MKNQIIQTRKFSKQIDSLFKKKQLLLKDYEDFKEELSDSPETGDLITGTGGLRKIRLKSASRGKSGGFRVCYYYFTQNREIFLIDIYAKNEKETLTMEDKKSFREIIDIIKGLK